MKKVLILILAVVLSFSVFAMVACNTCETHVDANHDGICDVCEAEGVTYEHIDANHDGKCDVCSVSGLTVSHVDANSDGICDVCQNKEAWVTALADAKAYVDTLYLNESKNTTDSFNLVTVVAIGADKFSVTWKLESSVANQTAAVLGTVDAETKLQPVNVTYNEQSNADVPYTLVGTISDAAGHSVVVEYERQVPKFKTATWAEYKAACEENDEEAIITIRAYVIGAVSVTSSGSKGSLYLQDADGNGYYAYAPKLDSSVTASEEALDAYFPFGTEVLVSGSCTVYGGQYEFNKGCTVVKTGNVADEGVLTFENVTEVWGTAKNQGDHDVLVGDQNKLVVIEEAIFTRFDGKYYYFTVNGVEFNIYRTNYFMASDDDITALFNKFEAGKAATIKGIVSCYGNLYQIYPLDVDCISNVHAATLDNAGKVEFEKGNLSIETEITADSVIDLPSAGGTQTDVAIAWAFKADTTHDCATIADGKLTITLPAEATTITLVATLTCGDVTDTKEIEIKVESSKIDWKDTAFALDLIDTLADGATTEEFYYFYGTVGEIYNTEYCNFYLLDKDGNSIIVYGLYAPNGTDRYGSKRQIAEIPFKEGDLICMRAQVQKFKDKNGNITPELVNAVEIVTPEKGTEFFVGYNATEAIAICNALADGATTEEYSYFMGVVGEIYNTEYCNFYLTDANGGSIIVYGLYAPNGTDRYGSKRQIAEIPFAEGDIIYIRSQVQKFKDKNGNITPELVNAVLVSFYTPAAVIPDDVIVNVSDLTAGDITESKELATGITLLATADKKVTVESNGKKIECFDFTQRLKLNGTMGSDYRAIKLEVSAPCKIVVYAIAGSSSATDRNLVLNDSTATLVKSINVLGDKLYKVEYEITAAGTYYLGSDNSSINLYYIGIYYGETLAHECDRKCHCGGCLVADCTDEACATKCPGHENHTTIEAALAGAKNDTVEISGTVSKIDYAWSDSSKNMSYTLSDGTNTIYVYKSASKVGIGDVVKVVGILGEYNGIQVGAGSTATITTAHVCAEWNSATCEDAELCKVCGEAKEGSVALGHTYASGVCSVCGEAEPSEGAIKIDLVTNFATYASAWTSSYEERAISLADVSSLTGTLTLSRANKQSSTITDRPVICAKNVVQYVTLDLGTTAIGSVKFDLLQWGTKTFADIHIEYYDATTETWVTCSDVITTPAAITSTVLPAGVTKVRLSFIASSSSNTQIGLTAVEVVLAETAE